MICIGGMELISLRLVVFNHFMNYVAWQTNLALMKFVRLFQKLLKCNQMNFLMNYNVCYNHHVNTLTSQMRVEQMLPIVDLDPNEADDSYSLTFELETSREEILEQLLPQFAEV